MQELARTGPRPVTVLLILLVTWLLMRLLPAPPPAVQFTPHHAERTAAADDTLRLYRFGVTQWICGVQQTPEPLVNAYLIATWDGLLTAAHEVSHARDAERSGCAAANAAWGDPVLAAAGEARAFCAEIQAGMTMGAFREPTAPMRRAAHILATGNSYRWMRLSEAEAWRLIEAACATATR